MYESQKAFAYTNGWNDCSDFTTPITERILGLDTIELQAVLIDTYIFKFCLDE